MPEGRYYCHDEPRSILERVSNMFTEPWLRVTGFTFSLYLHTTHEAPRGPLAWNMLLGLPLLALSLACAPLAVLGFVVRVFTCMSQPDRLPYRYLHVPPSIQNPDKGDAKTNSDRGTEVEHISSQVSTSANNEPSSSFVRPKDHLVFMTANVLMSYDLIVKFNNGIPVQERLSVVARRLTAQNTELNLQPNLRESVASLAARESVVVSQLPAVDVLLLQEVISEEVGRQLALQLSSAYSYFLYDVAEHSFAANRWCAGSGLFLASKLRIECAHFRPFTRTTGVGQIACYGALFAKLDASPLEPNAVVYVTNVHNQAYDETLLHHATSEAQLWTHEFVRATKKPGEKILSTVYGGDFNGDNISPADRPLQEHPVWEEYLDACREGPGVDQPWAVGTEMRQKKMYLSATRDPKAFAEVLRDDARRRLFVIDADVKAHTHDLMSCEPLPDADGEVRPKSWGGLRRIDRLLLHTPKTLPTNSILSKTNPELLSKWDNSSVSEASCREHSASQREGDHRDILRKRQGRDPQKIEKLDSSESLDLKQGMKTEMNLEQLNEENILDKNKSGFEKLYGKKYDDIEETDLPVVESVWFPTVLSSLTDHIPYIIQVKVCSNS